MSKSLSDTNKFYDNCSILLIILFAFVCLLLATRTPTIPAGESDDYMLATISLENRFSLKFLPSDVQQAKRDFPEHYEYIKFCYYMGFPYTYKTQSGDTYCFYLSSYSLACIPMKWVLKALHLSQSYAFAITNAIFYVLALLIVFYKLKANRKAVFFTILLLMCSPAIRYISWPSAEIFILSLVVISLVYFVNGRHKLAGFFVSIAGSLNPTIMMYGAIIIVDYFLDLFKTSKQNAKSLLTIFKVNYFDIVKLGVCFLPSLLYYYYHGFVIKSTSSMIVYGTAPGTWDRFIAFLFDLNFGFLPYFTIALFVFFVSSFIGIVKKDRRSILLLVAFLGTVGAYSLMVHINSGMTGIARYNVWASSIFIFSITTQSEKIFSKHGLQLVISLLLYVSAVISTFVVYNSGVSYLHMSPVATKVLDNYPSLYNPFPYTFVSRVEHVDGGYYYEKPVIYTTNKGIVRKILVTPETVNQVKDIIYGDKEDQAVLQKQINAIQKETGFQYINLGKSTNMKIFKNYTDVFDPKVNKNLADSCEGVYGNEGNFHWLSPNALIRLNANKKIDSGIHIIFTTSDYLLSLNPGVQLKVRILINDQHIKEVPIDGAKQYSVFIDRDQIPKPVDSIYNIKLLTNHYFNPSRMGISVDNRDLSIQLFYIGARS